MWPLTTKIQDDSQPWPSFISKIDQKYAMEVVIGMVFSLNDN